MQPETEIELAKEDKKTKTTDMKEVKKIILEIEKYTNVAREILRIHLRGLSKEAMIVKINELNLTDKSLIFLCEVIALETEDYEICTAVTAIRKARGLVKPVSS